MTDGNDHDTVVVKDSGSSAGMILGILAVIIVLAGLWYFAMGPGSSGGGTTTQENNPDVNIEVPVEPAGAGSFVIARTTWMTRLMTSGASSITMDVPNGGQA